MRNLINSVNQWGLLLACMLFASFTNAQSFKVKHTSGILEIGEMIGNIYIEAYNGSEIVIEGGERYHMPERAQGLKSISSVNDNTQLGLNYTKKEDRVIIRAVRRRHTGDYKIKVPQQVKLRVQITTSWCSKIKVKNFSSEVSISTRHAKIILDNLTGKVDVNSRHGLVQATFEQMNEHIRINARHGGIDITLPEKAKASLRANTRYGEIFTNMDVKSTRTNDEMANLSRSADVSAQLNGGGKELRLSARHANIYIRKK